MTRRGRMDKGEREPGRADVIIREPGRGLLWGAGMFGCTETFHSEAARQATRPAPEEAPRDSAAHDSAARESAAHDSAARDSADDGRVHELLEELLGDVDG